MTDMIEITIPSDSALQASLADADFCDAYDAPLKNAALSPTDIFLRASGVTPLWGGVAMSLSKQPGPALFTFPRRSTLRLWPQCMILSKS